MASLGNCVAHFDYTPYLVPSKEEFTKEKN